MKKKIQKLGLNAETVAALQDGRLYQIQGGHFSIPAFYTCPECAPPAARRG